jgi:ribosomal subunit interface protein
MEIPVQVTFRDMDPSPTVEQLIRDKAAKLETYFPRITGCRVTIESPHRSQRKGRHFRVRIDLTVPGSEIVAEQSAGDNDAQEDAYAAIRDAFDHARRELQDYARKLRGEVKSHDRITRS